ncbi:hypothetical protein ACIRYZ_44005 [Kitasatospora sp. NPDC101155]|uniref:hypothetical protein n=1 Tax=Kitasatospora sp. NPDC101155 TaxID=3364097 RepID=UPI00380AADCF
MPSVMGLLEERERAARQRVEALQAELREAEAVWERFVIARKTVGEVLAESPGGKEVARAVVDGERPAPVAADGLAVPVLAGNQQPVPQTENSHLDVRR